MPSIPRRVYYRKAWGISPFQVDELALSRWMLFSLSRWMLFSLSRWMLFSLSRWMLFSLSRWMLFSLSRWMLFSLSRWMCFPFPGGCCFPSPFQVDELDPTLVALRERWEHLMGREVLDLTTDEARCDTVILKGVKQNGSLE